ncbi:hypothetical protein [Microbacterium sp. CIAB417]|uniref:hypothetical protein n=1 Tax=Microbacterium sp. CIAB417 TaxID=2860287 RepID=UPI001FADD83A|nr:hypothetical protein [Microbacterium sp. CIAB417]
MSDDELFARLRAAAEALDPVPEDLADRMVAVVAVADLSREYALLTLMEGIESPVRGDAETTTLQFSDGSATVLLHISGAEGGARRVDGWIDAEASEVRLTQGERTWTTEPAEHGRFAFEDVPAGLCRVQVVTQGDVKDLLTPQFEV